MGCSKHRFLRKVRGWGYFLIFFIPKSRKDWIRTRHRLLRKFGNFLNGDEGSFAAIFYVHKIKKSPQKSKYRKFSEYWVSLITWNFWCSKFSTPSSPHNFHTLPKTNSYIPKMMSVHFRLIVKQYVSPRNLRIHGMYPNYYFLANFAECAQRIYIKKCWPIKCPLLFCVKISQR